MKVHVILLIIASTVLSLRNYEQAHTVLYHRTTAPEGTDWKLWQEAETDQLVTFTLALKQRNLDKLEELFWANSDPKHPNFAKHLSKDKILKLVAPSEDAQNRIIEWIQVTATEVSGKKASVKNMEDSIRVTASVADINELFQTTLHAFVNTKTQEVVFKHLGPLSVPSKLAPHIELITGITEFPPSPIAHKRMESKSDGVKGQAPLDNLCNVPYNMKKLYNIPLDLVVNNPLVNASIYAELSGIAFGVPELKEYEIANNLAPNPINCILGNAANHFDPNRTAIEAQLDVQALEGISPGVTMCFYMMKPENGWIYEFTLEIFNSPNAPLIVSMSYAWDEDKQCMDPSNPDSGPTNCTNLHIPNSFTYVQRTNVEFMKLGLAGFTFLSAAGDGGTVGNHGSIDHCTSMEPLFPASSPYLTAVGATSIEPSTGPHEVSNGTLPPVCTDPSYYCNCSTSTNEQPALANNSAQFDTGGGFSNYNPMPSYQKQAVQAYLTSGVNLPTSSLWNASGRAYPDVSVIGSNFCMIDDNEGDSAPACEMIGGSSVSTPIWAGIVALLNQDRMNAGKTPLGFINQIIYQMFAESTSKYFNNKFGNGNNSGRCPSKLGFNMKEGFWTPITGVGSPHFDQIRQYIAKLP